MLAVHDDDDDGGGVPYSRRYYFKIKQLLLYNFNFNYILSKLLCMVDFLFSYKLYKHIILCSGKMYLRSIKISRFIINVWWKSSFIQHTK